MLKFFVGVSIFCALTQSATAKIIDVEEDKAKSTPIEISVANGQASSIKFSNNQIIDFVMLPDQSRSIYNTNAPIDSGNATSIYLRKIDKLDIPGATQSNTPNLMVETIDEQGNKHQYEFMLNVSSAVERDRVTINPAPVPPPPKPEPKPEPVTTIKTQYGDATPADVALGIEMAIKNKDILADGAIAIAAKEYVAITRNGAAAQDALIQTKLPLSVVSKLGTLGQEEDARRRIIPLPEEFPANVNSYSRSK